MATDDRREKEQAKKRAAKKAAQDKRRRVAGTSQGSRTRVVEGVDVTEEQYRSYQELRRTDPKAASLYVDTVRAYPDRPDQAESVKATLQLSAKQRGEAKKEEVAKTAQRERSGQVEPDTGYGSSAAGERRLLIEPQPTSLGNVWRTTGKPDEKTGQYKEEEGFFEARGPSMRTGRRYDEKGKPLSAAARASATEQFLTSKGQAIPAGSATSAEAANRPLAKGLQITGQERIWLSETGGVYAPARGHMQDPDAPGGRLAGKEMTSYSTINEMFIKLWEMTPLERMRFQRAQGIAPTGDVGEATQEAWKNVLVHAARLTAAGQKINPEALYGFRLDKDKPERGGGGPGTAGGGPRTTTTVALTNRGEAKRLLNAIFRQKLGRGVTEDEVSMFQAQLNASEKKSPKTSVGELNAAGSLETQNVSGGLDPEQFTEDYLMETKGGEANARMVGVDYFDAALKAIGAAV